MCRILANLFIWTMFDTLPLVGPDFKINYNGFEACRFLWMANVDEIDKCQHGLNLTGTVNLARRP
jgi:hypothetical protein